VALCNAGVAFDLYSRRVSDYHAYLIRFQRREGHPHWCATLENVHTREVLNFVTERELLVYLLQTLADEPEQDPARPGGETSAEA
jgi:hypothetical protein